MLDITKAKAVADRENDGVSIDITDAAGNAIEGVSMVVAGSYSQRFRDAQDAIRKWNKKNPNQTDAQSDRKVLELLAACVISWVGIGDNDTTVPCTATNAIALFEAAPWVREQVSKAVFDHAGFFGKASGV